MATKSSDIRKQILKQRGVEMKKHSRKPVRIDQLRTPYKTTRLMQLVMLQNGARLENLIFAGTIYDVEKKLGIDASTISKWRKIINAAFFGQFEEV